MPIKVRDIMSSPVYSIDVNKNAREAGELFRKVRRGFLIVTKNKKPIGTLSESDVIQKIVAENKTASKIKIKNIMSSPIVGVRPEDELIDVVRKMKLNNIHRLPVVDKDKLVGVVSLTDVARTSPEMLDLLEYRLKMKEEPFVLREEITSGICDSCENYFTTLQNKNDQWLCESCRDESEAEE